MRGEYYMPVFWISAAALVFLFEIIIPVICIGIPMLMEKLRRNRK